MKKLVALASVAVLMSFTAACNNGGKPVPNAALTEEMGDNVKTPAGGGTDMTNKRSQAPKPPAPENLKQGSDVPPAQYDESRPHPQQQEGHPAPAARAATVTK